MRGAIILTAPEQLNKLIFDLTESRARGAKSVMMYITDEDGATQVLQDLLVGRVNLSETVPPEPDWYFGGSIMTLAFASDVTDLIEAELGPGQEENKTTH